MRLRPCRAPRGGDLLEALPRIDQGADLRGRGRGAVEIVGHHAHELREILPAELIQHGVSQAGDAGKILPSRPRGRAAQTGSPRAQARPPFPAPCRGGE